MLINNVRARRIPFIQTWNKTRRFTNNVETGCRPFHPWRPWDCPICQNEQPTRPHADMYMIHSLHMFNPFWREEWHMQGDSIHTRDIYCCKVLWQISKFLRFPRVQNKASSKRLLYFMNPHDCDRYRIVPLDATQVAPSAWVSNAKVQIFFDSQSDEPFFFRRNREKLLKSLLRAGYNSLRVSLYVSAGDML